MTTLGCVQNTRFNPTAEIGLLIKDIFCPICVIGKSQRKDKFLRHATGKINDFVMPKITIETAIGWTMGIAIEKGEELGNVGQGFLSQ